jgi:O-antigen ligase
LSTLMAATWRSSIDSRLRIAAHSPAVGRIALPGVSVLVAALLAGTVAAGKADALLGEKPALLLLGALVAGAFFLVFPYLGSSAVLIWPIAATAGYLIQIPRGNPVLTFDRVWIGGLIAYIALNPRRIPRTPATRLLAFALVWLVVSYGLRAVTTSMSIQGPVKPWVDAILLPAILFVACERYCLRGPDRARRLAASLMIAGGILGAIGIAERIAGFELASLTGGSIRYDANIDTTRISGPYSAPEPYALSLAICFAATLYWILSRKRGSGYFWALVLGALQVAGIALALFRAGWIAAILVLVASLGLRPGRFGRTFALTMVAVAVTFAATLQAEQNKTVGTRVGNTDNINARLATYKEGVEIFRAAPVFGVGVGEYHAVAEHRRPEVVQGVRAVNHPHSSYFGLLAEQGLVGFLPFLVLSYAVWRLVATLRSISFRSREATYLLATVTGAALAYLIMSLTLTMLPYSASNTFFAAFLGVASGRLDALARYGQTTAASPTEQPVSPAARAKTGRRSASS